MENWYSAEVRTAAITTTKKDTAVEITDVETEAVTNLEDLQIKPRCVDAKT